MLVVSVCFVSPDGTQTVQAKSTEPPIGEKFPHGALSEMLWREVSTTRTRISKYDAHGSRVVSRLVAASHPNVDAKQGRFAIGCLVHD
jgi:hypothetical protein